MTPVKDILPRYNHPEEEIIVYAKDQPQYIPLPMWKGSDEKGLRIARFKLTWKERLQVLFSGSLWLRVLTFNNPLQPVLIETKCPLKLQ